ncbi:MAG: SRPBCC domain-containing protein [Bacillota bacterium]
MQRQNEQQQVLAPDRESRLTGTRGAVLERIGHSPQDPAMIRVKVARTTVTTQTPPDLFYAAFCRWARYEEWAPGLQGPSHWLVVHQGGPGSSFILYDKPGPRHLAHFGVVTEVDRGRRFAWRAPFSEWQRVFIGTILELSPTSTGGSQVTETLYIDLREEHLPVVTGFLALEGLDPDSMTRFLADRLEGLDRLIRGGGLSDQELSDPFPANRVVAVDWPGRISTGEWVRVLYADGELDFDGPPSLVFNAFTRFARYAEWTPMIHVGIEWQELRAGGVGSKFLLWEKPGDRQVLHYAAVTEMERNRKFTWRAPFSEWGKVFIGTSMVCEPRPDGGTHAYHVLYADLPVEYLPIFSGFGSMHGFDMEFETFHIYEEARGFNQLLRSGAFSGVHADYLFDHDQTLARDWPLPYGQPWPNEVVSLKPDRVITAERLAVEVAEILADRVPPPAFLRTYRSLQRTHKYHPEVQGHGHSHK